MTESGGWVTHHRDVAEWQSIEAKDAAQAAEFYEECTDAGGGISP